MQRNDGLTLTQTEITSLPQTPELGSLRHAYLWQYEQPCWQFPLNLPKSTESTGVLIKYDRRRTATKDSLSAGIPTGSQPIDYIAAIIVDVPYWMSSPWDLIGRRGTYSDFPLHPEEWGCQLHSWSQDKWPRLEWQSRTGQEQEFWWQFSCWWCSERL